MRIYKTDKSIELLKWESSKVKIIHLGAIKLG